MGKRTAKGLRDRFIDWQCRIRQIAMRQDGGRPSPGMRPRVLDVAGREIAPGLTVLLVAKKPAESAALFRHMVMSTHDPHDVYARALSYLQADYFQKAESFRDRLLAVLDGGSRLAAALTSAGACRLEFAQFAQSYSLPCAVRELEPGDQERDAAIWHNRLFNPALPDAVHVLAFKPDWAEAKNAAGPV